MATTSTALVHTLKLILMSTGVLSLALLLTPQIFSFTSGQLPAIWTSLRSWLRPPYLYFIINGIIITIAASSRIHHHFTHPHLAEAKSPAVSPAPEVSSGFSFSFGVVNFENHRGTAEVFAYDETTTFGAREAETVADHEAEKDRAVQKPRRIPDLDSVAPEFEPRKSVRTKLSPAPQPAPPLARQETFEVVSTFFQSQMPAKASPSPARASPSPARTGQNRRPSALTSLNEETVAGFGANKQGKVENYKTTTFGAREAETVTRVADHEAEKDRTVQKLRDNRDLDSVVPEFEPRRSVLAKPSPAPRPAPPLARQETFEIVSTFFQSQMEKKASPSPVITGQNRKPSALTSLNEEPATGSGAKKEGKMENYKTAPRKTANPPQLARQETSEIVSSFFESQIDETTKLGRSRRLSPQSTVTFSDETVSSGRAKNYHNAPQMTPSHLPPPPPQPLAPLARQETSEIVSSFFQSQMEKPPASARFGHHRKTSRSTPEGGKALKVAKAKKSESMESAWKTITEGRPKPLTRHLKKSDTWENQERDPAPSDPSMPSLMKKSGTFTGRTKRGSTVAAAAEVSKLKKDPSLSQEELNRRVEEFINKVNDDMRLQRQQSMQQFMDMINRGAH